MDANTPKFTFTDTASLVVIIKSPAQHGRLVIHQYPDLPVDVDLTAGPGLELNFIGNVRVNNGDAFVILRNYGAGATIGEFAGYPEGTKVYFGAASGTLTYGYDFDEDGVKNDVAIKDIRLNGTVVIVR